jgi:hypothetical protein
MARPDPIIALRQQASRARRLAGVIGDRRTIDCLTDLARENDADADRLEAFVENERRSFAPP